MIGEHGDLRILRASGDFELEPLDDEPRRPRPFLGFAAGLAAGLLATLAMDGFHVLAKSVGAGVREGEEGEDSTGSEGDGDEPSTAKLGRRIARSVLHRELDDTSAKLASGAVHYGYGTLMGGLYGLAAELFPKTAIAAGAPYGTLLFALGDEVMVPALGLAKPPTEYPVSTHARALSAHLVYGTTLDLLRRGILGCIDETLHQRRATAREADAAVVWIDEATEIEGGVL